MLVPSAFSQRPASTEWEPLPIARIPGLSLWVWYRPEQLPSGLMVSIPAEIVAACVIGFPFTLSDLLMSAGVLPNQFHSVSLFGGPSQPATMFAPFLNHPVPAVIPGARPEISIGLAEQPAIVPNPMSAQADAVVDESSVDAGFEDDQFPDLQPIDDGTPLSDRAMYDRIESSWKASIQMERQMTALRHKLSSVLASLGKLDRDLSAEERLAAEREDRDAWQDARRWMRDLASKCHREIKSFDIGMTSGAGKRNWMEETYQQIIQPRVACAELETYRRDFENYRKDMVNLQRAMNTALQTATQNGTQRAQRVLGVIGRKIRQRRASMREPIGGTNMDKSCRRKR